MIINLISKYFEFPSVGLFIYWPFSYSILIIIIWLTVVTWTGARIYMWWSHGPTFKTLCLCIISSYSNPNLLWVFRVRCVNLSRMHSITKLFLFVICYRFLMFIRRTRLLIIVQWRDQVIICVFCLQLIYF